MFLKKNTTTIRGKSYVNYCLVESVSTPKGPRHKVVCSLGRLDPGPPEQWLSLAHKLQNAISGQPSLFEDPETAALIESLRQRAKKPPSRGSKGETVPVRVDLATSADSRPAGAIHAGHQMWQKLGIGSVLLKAGLPREACTLTEAMVLNRLIAPLSEHAMPAWISRTALNDVLPLPRRPSEAALYRNLDRLHAKRSGIDAALSERERDLFNLDDTIWLYDLTSTYFEGACEKNPQAQRGYSRDNRPDCKQVVVGLVVNRDGFPLAHEVFDGNRTDGTTLDEMLAKLEGHRAGRGPATIVVDRGLASGENLEQIRARGHHYLVAARQQERNEHLTDFAGETGWDEVIRKPSPANRFQKKSRVWIKRKTGDGHLVVLCRSDGRQEKDQAIRKKHLERFQTDLAKLKKRVETGRLKQEPKIQQAIGRLRERHARVARYHEITYDASSQKLSVTEDLAKKASAEELDGAYILKTSRLDLDAEEAWRTYMLLTRVEAAFRDIKSPLGERPVYHQLPHRVQSHIFLCLLAYHLLVAIEHTLLSAGIHLSWATVRDILQSHAVNTLILPASDGRVLTIRKGTEPDTAQQDIYRALGIPAQIMSPIKTWLGDSHLTKPQTIENQDLKTP